MRLRDAGQAEVAVRQLRARMGMGHLDLPARTALADRLRHPGRPLELGSEGRD
ncbi:hypothetical protein [Caldinitratiruptor microaerophilus]|uniref:Uncharacterized protein n=1 Tax=Caldinitratiruptor microaerophilus TaxID=671077 RepID=A0AA35G7X6_9FIRM|nr:hypothetical protein [Caldinitratiruptor microaerophilus]BDG60380.1 hypothetical protein caldi_14700 [Caldinitratiruptor microaerophilus]